MRLLSVMMIGLFALIGVAVSNGYGGPNTSAPAEQFVVTGVLVDGERGIAWLLEPTLTKNEVIPVRPGDSIGPYRLTRILEDRVEMEGPKGTVMIPLYSPGSGGPPTAVVSAQPSTSDPAAERHASSRMRGAHARGRDRSAVAARVQRPDQAPEPSKPANNTAELPSDRPKGSQTDDADQASEADVAGPGKAQISTAPPPSYSFGAITPQEVVPPPPLQHLQQVLQQSREAQGVAQTDPTGTASDTSTKVNTFKKGDPKYRNAFQSFFGGRQ